jgi:hypothetical protein
VMEMRDLMLWIAAAGTHRASSGLITPSLEHDGGGGGGIAAWGRKNPSAAVAVERGGRSGAGQGSPSCYLERLDWLTTVVGFLLSRINRGDYKISMEQSTTNHNNNVLIICKSKYGRI